MIGCEIEEMIDTMRIDENKDFALTSYRKTKNRPKVKLSDHNYRITNIKAKWKKKESKPRIKMYNIKN